VTALDEQRGFSAMAAEYDALAESHPIVVWIRQRIRDLVEAQLTPGASILEINAGSGLDAAYFASGGYRVHATDIAPGMLAAMQEKAADPELQGRMSWQALSFERLEEVEAGPYDLIFSNLGGLNCTNDLAAVARGLPHVLKPGGRIVWVVMPSVCPWEMTQALRGHFGTAKRRFSKQGTLANVGGDHVRTWYHSPHKVEQALGSDFRVEAVRSFCLFAPPSFFTGFVRRHPRLVSGLMRLDDALGGWWPFNRCGDFYAIVAQYQPSR
jgi:ubiquinone/menaquinone biosynthesis C-methylase UbiE